MTRITKSIPLTHHINSGEVSFLKAKDNYIVTLSFDEQAYLMQMLFDCITQKAKDDQELEILILEEARMSIKKKYDAVTKKTNMKFTPAQTRTVFLWLNEMHFTHPLHHGLAARLVDQIYRQII